ncbi:MAG TPA: hypothetical protein VLG50_05405 [Candidatus Saccharimonadales bacterium]|nr:hypothetical protein [Candidatus Saccharimonadales bacterium]
MEELVTDVNDQILAMLDDETLVQYCQISTFAQSVCKKDTRIQQRIALYHKYKQFNVLHVMNNMDDLINRPYMFYRMERVNHDDKSVIKYDFFIFDDTLYSHISFVASAITQYNSRYIVKAEKYDETATIGDILRLYHDSEGVEEFGYDISTFYQLYVANGLTKYAIHDTLNYLQYHYNILTFINDKSFVDFYTLLGLYWWYKMNCIIVGVIGNQIEERDINIDFEFLQSDRMQHLKNQLINSVMLYHDLLVDYINQLNN